MWNLPGGIGDHFCIDFFLFFLHPFNLLTVLWGQNEIPIQTVVFLQSCGGAGDSFA